MIPFAIGFTMVTIALIILWIKKVAPESEMMRDFDDDEFKKFFRLFSIIGTLLILYGVITFFTAKPPFLTVEYGKESYFVDGKIDKIGYLQNSLFQEDGEYELLVISWEDLDEEALRFELVSPTKEVVSDQLSIKKINAQREKNLLTSIEAHEMYKLSPFTLDQAGEWQINIYEGSKKFAKWEIKAWSQQEIDQLNEDFEKNNESDPKFEKFRQFLN